MRILLAQEERYFPALNGSSKSSRGLLEGLAKLGHECLVLAPLRLAAESEIDFIQRLTNYGIELVGQTSECYEFELNNVNVNSLPIDRGLETPDILISRSIFIKQKAASFQPDVIIVSGDPRHYLLSSLQGVGNAKLIFVAHNHAHLPFGPLSVEPDPIQTARLFHVDQIWSVSNYSRDYIKQFSGLSAESISMPAYAHDMLRAPNQQQKKYVTLMNGRVEKGGLFFCRLAKRNPNVAFAIVDYKLPQCVRQQAQELSNLSLLAPIERSTDIYSVTKILCMPSIQPETFGLSCVEAMLCGCPVLVSDAGGLPEAALDMAYVLPTPDVEENQNNVDVLGEWHQALSRLTSDSKQIDWLAHQGRKAALKFVDQHSPIAIEKILESICHETSSPNLVLTDAYDVGYTLATDLFERGYNCYHVSSGEQVHEDIRANQGESVFSKQFSQTQLDSTLKVSADCVTELKTFQAQAVMAGNETGVMLADYLADSLDVNGNGIELSEHRRNKYLMAQAAQQAGLSVPKQHTFTDQYHANYWVNQHDLWPVVAKPPHSLGSEDVFLCRNEQELAMAFGQIYGKRNRTGLVNEYVILQQLLFGDQYVVDTVSYNGQHCLAGIWQYGRPEWAPAVMDWVLNDGPWPDEIAHLTWSDVQYAAIGSNSKKMLAGNTQLSRMLFNYASKLLDGLSIKLGPAHFELMHVDGRIYLIEVGARLHGAPSTHWMSRICRGVSQLDLSIKANLKPETFKRCAQSEYELIHHGYKFRLHPWQAGYFKGFLNLDWIENLESFRGFYYMASSGFVQVQDCLGVVALIHSDPRVLESDVKKMRAWERENALYDIQHHESYTQKKAARV